MPTETVNANPSQTAANRAAAALKLHFAQARMESMVDVFTDAENDLTDAKREFETAYDADVKAGGPV